MTPSSSFALAAVTRTSLATRESAAVRVLVWREATTLLGVVFALALAIAL